MHTWIADIFGEIEVYLIEYFLCIYFCQLLWAIHELHHGLHQLWYGDDSISFWVDEVKAANDCLFILDVDDKVDHEDEHSQLYLCQF